jgi:hypothetical protein
MFKQNFKIALALANMTQRDWALQHHVVPGTVTRLLDGKRKSRRLKGAMDDFIKAEFQKLPHLTKEVLKAA